MIDISADLQVTQPTITVVGNKFISIENYLSIITYDTNLIKIKTKIKTIKITGDKLLLKYITDNEIGIKGIINGIEYVD
jgi:sporulation protein YqfC